jgi:hypothetical protein
MQITRDQQRTGGADRTPREEIVALFTGHRPVEPEQYSDCSQSEGWAWRSNPQLCTFKVQLGAQKEFGKPFAQLDSQAGREKGGGGIATYPFNNVYLPLSDRDDEDGERIIDLNPDNFDERIAHFLSLYPQVFKNGIPVAGGTEVMEAVTAGDEHFLSEFGKLARVERPIRGRVLWTDGMLTDAAQFIRYLEQATAGTGGSAGLGVHGEWDEAWAVAILGEGPGEDGQDYGKQAFGQYNELRGQYPWIHPYYFQGVANPKEVAEDMAVAVVPLHA